MSKAALKDLATLLAKSDPKKDFRNKTINPQLHGYHMRATSIKKELIAELEAVRTAKDETQRDERIREFLTDADIGAAAMAFRKYLNSVIDNPKTGLRRLETDPEMIVGKFGAVSSALKIASDAAVAVLKKKINEKTTDYVPFLGSDKLVNLDHTRTVAETRIAADINTKKINVVDLIAELRSTPRTSRKDFEEVYNNVLDINSYYSNDGTKHFDIVGTVERPVAGELRSGRNNQLEGAAQVKARVKAFKEAIDLAIKDVKWEGRSASDSFVTATMKQLNNAAVKAGATGKIQRIDRSKSTANVKTKKKTKSSLRQITNPVSISANLPQKTTGSLISLQKINDYINARLPEAIRANMGPGSLENRTGTFASSGRMVGGSYTPQGFPSLVYTYQRSPYDVFDSRLGKAPWNTPSRDPKKLLESSIRDIAKELAIGRFYLRRL